MENDRFSSIIIFRCTFTIYIQELRGKNDIFRVIRKKNITLVNLVLLLENVSFWLNLLSGELQV